MDYQCTIIFQSHLLLRRLLNSYQRKFQAFSQARTKLKSLETILSTGLKSLLTQTTLVYIKLSTMHPRAGIYQTQTHHSQAASQKIMLKTSSSQKSAFLNLQKTCPYTKHRRKAKKQMTSSKSLRETK